ncbi:MAG TPA: hypothetical protein VFV33_12175, partial [Gemmatimonadaceae bacterium]|nr:hypothetical protein [Gemmatimonadaceae bacterium]
MRRTLADQRLPLEIETITARVPRNATLETILKQHELAVEFVEAAVASARTVFNPRTLRADRP